MELQDIDLNLLVVFNQLLTSAGSRKWPTTWASRSPP
jgi:hypothetical protein